MIWCCTCKVSDTVRLIVTRIADCDWKLGVMRQACSFYSRYLAKLEKPYIWIQCQEQDGQTRNWRDWQSELVKMDMSSLYDSWTITDVKKPHRYVWGDISKENLICLHHSSATIPQNLETEGLQMLCLVIGLSHQNHQYRYLSHTVMILALPSKRKVSLLLH